MGMWGPELYDCDIAQDVRAVFQEISLQKSTIEEAATYTATIFSDALKDPDEGSIVSAVLADQLWHNGSVENCWRNQTLVWIQNGGDIACWHHLDDEIVQRRRDALDELKARLLRTPKTSKKINVVTAKRKQLLWEPEQIYALPLESTKATELGLNGEYALIYIRGYSHEYDGYRNPKVWVKLTQGGILPTCAQEFNHLEFVKMGCTPYSMRFAPFKHEDELPSSFRQAYCPDQWGCLCEFTATMLQANGCHPPKTLRLLGSFDGIEAPAGEYQRYKSALYCRWKFADEDILRNYWLYNLRNAAAYRSPGAASK